MTTSTSSTTVLETGAEGGICRSERRSVGVGNRVRRDTSGPCRGRDAKREMGNGAGVDEMAGSGIACRWSDGNDPLDDLDEPLDDETRGVESAFDVEPETNDALEVETASIPTSLPPSTIHGFQATVSMLS